MNCARVLNFLTTTGIKPIIDKVYPLADAAQAQQRLAQGQHFGKIVLHMRWLSLTQDSMTMKVIGGAARGRKLKVPKGLAVRPTAARVKESLFNILPHDFSGLRVLDLVRRQRQRQHRSAQPRRRRSGVGRRVGPLRRGDPRESDSTGVESIGRKSGSLRWRGRCASSTRPAKSSI